MGKNTINHFEWRTRDTAKLKAFYGGIFKWKFDEVLPGQYTMVKTGNEDAAGGIMQIAAGEQMPTGLTNYITVDDLAASEEQIKAHGGQVMLSRHEVPGRGWFSIFTDPDHNVMAIWKDLPKKERKAQKKALKAASKAEKKSKKVEKAGKKDKKAKKKPANDVASL